jgi:NTE family protein
VSSLGAKSARAMRHSEGFQGVEDAPWLVLGGGGIKGLAHVGAWRALDEAGICPAGIIGTSIGALVGALAASDTSHEEGWRLALELERHDIVQVNRRSVWINGIRQVSVFRGGALRDHLEGLLPEAGWEALELPMLINAVELTDGSTAWFGPGARTDLSLLDAVYASCALPVFYPPLERDGKAYIDGGAAHPLPLHKAAEAGAGRIIAVDAGSGRTGDVAETIEQGMLGIHQRVFAIMTHRRRREALERWEGPPLVYVRPRLDGYGTFGFEHIEYFLEEGYRATKEALARLGS